MVQKKFSEIIAFVNVAIKYIPQNGKFAYAVKTKAQPQIDKVNEIRSKAFSDYNDNLTLLAMTYEEGDKRGSIISESFVNPNGQQDIKYFYTPESTLSLKKQFIEIAESIKDDLYDFDPYVLDAQFKPEGLTEEEEEACKGFIEFGTVAVN